MFLTGGAAALAGGEVTGSGNMTAPLSPTTRPPHPTSSTTRNPDAGPRYVGVIDSRDALRHSRA